MQKVKDELLNILGKDHVEEIFAGYRLFSEQCKQVQAKRKRFNRPYGPMPEIKEIWSVLDKLKKRNWLTEDGEHEITKTLFNQILNSPRGHESKIRILMKPISHREHKQGTGRYRENIARDLVIGLLVDALDLQMRIQKEYKDKYRTKISRKRLIYPLVADFLIEREISGEDDIAPEAVRMAYSRYKKTGEKRLADILFMDFKK